MSTVLKRQPVECDASVILEKAQELGHEELLRKAQKVAHDNLWLVEGRLYSRERFVPSAAHIEGAMVSLGFQPYTEESVAEYKARIDRSLILGNIPGYFGEYFPPIALGISILAAPFWILSAAILLICGVSCAPLGVSGIVMLSLFILGMAVMGSAEKGLLTMKKARWSSHHFEYYDLRKVPDFALQTAVDLSERCPGVPLRIEECHIQDEMVDPFLVAVCGPRKWYLEVWNEPGFEK